MGTSFTNDIILIEERYTFNFSDCTITNLKDLAENASFKEACEIFPRPQITYADKGNRIEVASGDKRQWLISMTIESILSTCTMNRSSRKMVSLAA